MLSNNKETPSNVRLSVEQFDHAALVVRDVSASVKWYKDWLGFDSLGSGQNAPPPLRRQWHNEARVVAGER